MPTSPIKKTLLPQTDSDAVARVERIKKLPKPLRQYIWSGQVEKSFMSAMSKQQVSDARVRAITSKLTGQVLFGKLHPNSFIKTLVEQGNVEQEKARAIARDVSAQVFAPVRNELMQVYQINKAPGSLAPMAGKQKPTNPPVTDTAKPMAGAQKTPPPAPARNQASAHPSAPLPSAVQPTMPKTQAPPAPRTSSGPAVTRDVQSGSIADVASRLKKVKPMGPQAHMVTPGAPPPKTATKQSQAGPNNEPTSIAGVPTNAPMTLPEQEQKPKGPVLSKGELLANEEVVVDDNNKQGRHGVFGHHAKTAKTSKKNLLKHDKNVPNPPLPPRGPVSPPDALAGNTVNLKPPIQ